MLPVMWQVLTYQSTLFQRLPKFVFEIDPVQKNLINSMWLDCDKFRHFGNFFSQGFLYIFIVINGQILEK